MDYIAVYTAILDHPKALRLSDRAFRALLGAWLYAGRHETAGYLPVEASPIVRLTPAVARQLEEAGWLHPNGSGWEIHDWEDHQQPLQEAQARRARARKRMSDHRQQMRAQDA